MDYHYTLGFVGWGAELPLWSLPILILIIIWTYFWKGPALWHSARRGEVWWFIIFLLVNTVGILELIYLLGVRNIKLRNIFKLK